VRGSQESQKIIKRTIIYLSYQDDQVLSQISFG
jgi:hypothetical protein